MFRAILSYEVKLLFKVSADNEYSEIVEYVSRATADIRRFPGDTR